MKKNFNTYVFIALLLLAAVFTITAVKPQSSSAYFTDYDIARGSKPLSYYFREEFHEDPHELIKELTVKNNSIMVEYVRVKVFAGSQIGIEYKFGENWSLGNDGYIYYGKPLAPNEETEKLVIELKPAEDFESDFNVVVAEETVPALYDVNGNPYADWEAKVIEE